MFFFLGGGGLGFFRVFLGLFRDLGASGAVYG